MLSNESHKIPSMASKGYSFVTWKLTWIHGSQNYMES